MSGFAVRDDGQGWRAVDSADFLAAGEWYTEDEPPDPVALPPTPEQVLATAYAKRDELLALAALRIAPLQYAVDLNDATDVDIDRLKAWQHYSVALNRIDQQAAFPDTIDWPLAPEA